MHAELEQACAAHEDEVVALRRQLHAHPELSDEEHATTELLMNRLQVAGLAPVALGRGTGAVCDIVGDPSGPLVVLRADIDALAMDDHTSTPYTSTRTGAAHACGHDAHTAIVLGAALALADCRAGLPGTVRVVFEPAEEKMPGGAVDVVGEGWIEGARAVFGLHCDPRIEVGEVGLREGPITAASDLVIIDVRGPGGHTARPHLTVDLVHALGLVATRVPALFVERLAATGDAVLVFGAVSAGDASNVIPDHGSIRGAARMHDVTAWDRSEAVLRVVLADVLAPTGAQWELTYSRGLPPVVNDVAATAALREAAGRVIGAGHVVATSQSMGADSFAWYGQVAPASYARLGVHQPGTAELDLHASTFDIDERAIGIGMRLLTQAAVQALYSGV